LPPYEHGFTIDAFVVHCNKSWHVKNLSSYRKTFAVLQITKNVHKMNLIIFMWSSLNILGLFNIMLLDWPHIRVVQNFSRLGHAEPANEDTPFTASRVVIAGLRPGGPASKLSDKLRPGDWLRSIDGQQVRGVKVNNNKKICQKFSK
jgi:hypothetical protein